MVRESAGWRLLLLGLAMLLLQACATGTLASGGLLAPPVLVPEGTHGLVFFRELRREESALAEARRAEVECALAQVWALARGVDEVGAQVEVRFWAQGGALTVLSHRTAQGYAQATKVDEAAFARGLRRLLTDYVGERQGEVVFTLHREQTEWRVDYRASSDVPRPPEAKTLPVRRKGVPVDSFSGVTQVAEEMGRLLRGAANSSAFFTATVRLEDDAVTAWEVGPYAGAGQEVGRAEQTYLQDSLIRALLPFIHGVGAREVRLELRGVHGPGEAGTRWRVVEATTLRQGPWSGEDEDLVAEYRALHETILREWREEVMDAGRLAVLVGTQELALWIIGGVITHGAGAFLKVVAPTLVTLLLRRGREVRGWLCTLLLRLPSTEQMAFRQLWARLNLKGARSLTHAEKSELRVLAKRLEDFIEAPLTSRDKKILRSAAREDFYGVYPELERLLVNAKGIPFPVHHRKPLEYAHLFPGVDINARSNLRAVDETVHSSINAVWTALRNAPVKVRADEVDEVVAIVDRYFGRWYNAPYERTTASALAEAEVAAMEQVKKLAARMSQGR